MSFQPTTIVKSRKTKCNDWIAGCSCMGDSCTHISLRCAKHLVLYRNLRHERHNKTKWNYGKGLINSKSPPWAQLQTFTSSRADYAECSRCLKRCSGARRLARRLRAYFEEILLYPTYLGKVRFFSWDHVVTFG